MFKEYVVVIGGSAGGMNALEHVLRPLPYGFPAAILVALHILPDCVSKLPQIVSRYCAIPVIEAHNGLSLEANSVYIAPPDVHMIIEHNAIALQSTPPIKNCRPAIDPLFISAASYRKRAIGIILSGLLDDGSAGLNAIKKQGGLTIIQSLEEAEYPYMPQNAAKKTAVDYCLSTANIASLLTGYVNGTLPGKN